MKEVGAAAPATSLTPLPLRHWQLTLTRLLVCETPARSAGVCSVDAGIVAVTSASQSVEVQHLLLVRCIRHTLMHRSTVEAQA